MGSVLAPLVVAVAGALAYGLSQNPKVAEIGRIALFCGAFWVVYLLARTPLRF